MLYRFLLISFFSIIAVFNIHAQAPQGAPENWFNLDLQKDGVPGVSTEVTYETILKGKKGTPIIVAVLDGGIDPVHEDLTSRMWRNPNEKPGNSKDDDNNGYTDDIYGWNFIGNPDGSNVHQDLLEITRLLVAYEEKYANVNPDNLRGKAKKEYQEYSKIKETVQEEAEKSVKTLAYYESLKENYFESEKALKQHFKTDKLTLDMLNNLETDDEKLATSAKMVGQLLENGLDGTYFDGAINYFKGRTIYYDTTFDPRDIVGDQYDDSYEWNYGNPDVAGPDAFHGTHVGGIIGADRNNGIGIKGVCDQAILMGVRVVPDGDERDKDVANGIRYAVDNGARIINMSFGKGYSWDKKVVDDAVKYAEAHDVLLVHAAGNDGKNNDTSDNFPNKYYEGAGWFSKKKASNWVEVGALNYTDNERVAAPFSNYGKKNVDLFAPGMAIHSTTPDNGYQDAQGTSMAAPVVAGVAALIRSHYPDLTAKQVREILMESVVEIDRQVIKPGTKDEMVNFKELSVTGGVVNALRAMELAAKTKPGKKPKAPKTRTIDYSSSGKSGRPRV
jgi:cell wall-associated protease